MSSSPSEKDEKKISKPFQFKHFRIEQDRCAMKVGTDGVLLGAWVTLNAAQKMLDIGTGTGVIALMLAQRAKNENIENFDIHAVEIDEPAYYQAIENIENSNFSDNIQIFKNSIQDFAKQTAVGVRYDLVVSNPPFFTGGTFSSNQDKNNVRHTVKLPHSDLLHATRTILSASGRFCVILPLIEGLRFIEIAQNFGFFCTRMTEVLPRATKNVERLMLEFSFVEKPLEKTQLTLREGDGYTQEYQNLTKNFYTIF